MCHLSQQRTQTSQPATPEGWRYSLGQSGACSLAIGPCSQRNMQVQWISRDSKGSRVDLNIVDQYLESRKDDGMCQAIPFPRFLKRIIKSNAFSEKRCRSICVRSMKPVTFKSRAACSDAKTAVLKQFRTEGSLICSCFQKHGGPASKWV